MRQTYEQALAAIMTSASDWVSYADIAAIPGVRDHILLAKKRGDIDLRVVKVSGMLVLEIRGVK